jgi:hypothetical protein
LNAVSTLTKKHTSESANAITPNSARASLANLRRDASILFSVGPLRAVIAALGSIRRIAQGVKGDQ